jgi:hypothetical protein
MRKLLLVAAVAAFGFVGSDARALTVVYNLAGSSFDLSSPGVIPFAGLVTGTLSVTYTDDGNGNIVDGPVTIGPANFFIDFTNGGLSAFGVTGGLNNVQGPFPAAPNSSSTGSELADALMAFTLDGQVDCDINQLCGAFGTPASTIVPPTNGVTQMQNANGTLTTFFATQPFNLPLSSTVTAVGTLTFVPEPGTLLLLGAGVMGLGAFGRKRAA